jgi:uncharacterized membrane protein YGL010W
MSTMLAEYGTYHRDRRNRMLHEIGIPLIVLAIIALLRLIHVGPIDVAALAIVATCAYYLTLDVPSAIAAIIAYAVLYAIAAAIPWWLALLIFVAGWIFQFVGHVYEGRKPAFLTNLLHLLVGPLWIAALAIRRVS